MVDGALFEGPVPVMLAAAQERIPRRVGRFAYEMKWDGYRTVVQVDPAGRVRLWSRRGTDLSSVFPDLAAAVAEQVPAGIVLDGEAVVWVDGRLSFDHLQQRMAAGGAAVRRLARQQPASYVAFDLLAVDGTDVRGLAWRDRRLLLDELAGSFTPPIQVSPVTDDHDTAVEWFTELPEATGIEGVVAKPVGSRYVAGERGWVKVKHRSLVDALVGAVIGPAERPEAIVAGRYEDGQLRIVGRSTALTPSQARQLSELLTPVASEEHPWPDQVGAGHFGGDPVTITHVAPTVVVEVSADAALQAGRHRHALRLVRIRDDIDPADLPGSSD